MNFPSLLIVLCLVGQSFGWDTPPTPEDIERDPNGTIDEMSYYNNRPSMIQEDNELAQALMKEFGFDKDVEIKKTIFKDFVYRLITMNESLPKQEKEFYTKVVEHFTASVPNFFPSKEIKKYLDTEDFNESIKSIIIDLYGEDTYKEFNNYDITPEQSNSTENNTQATANDGSKESQLDNSAQETQVESDYNSTTKRAINHHDDL